MEWFVALTVFIIILLLLIFPGMWIAVTLGVTGLLGLLITGHIDRIHAIGNIGWNTSNDFILTSIPLFVFMGEVILLSGLSANFYKAFAKWTRFIPGSLLHSNILACAMFSAISGSSVATAAGIGSVAIPEMKKYGYRKPMIYGSIASGGTLGILIPPSIVLILYGAMVQESVVKLFSAALVPGIVLTAMFLLYTLTAMLFKKNRVDAVHTSDLTVWQSIKGTFPLILLIVLVLGSLYTGKVTPTEAAALGAFLSILIGWFLGDLNLRKIVQAAFNAAKTSSMLLFIMIGAQIFSFAVVTSGINRALTSWISESGFPPLLLLTIVSLIYIVLGFFMDGPSMMILTIPLLYPVVVNAGFDSVWFGVILVILIELGQITPPMGLNLFMIKSIDKESTMKEVVAGAMPYICLMLALIVILTMFPQIALWLPNLS